MDQSRSVETIYKNAVEKRFSSLSDECVDISDENLDFFTSESLQLNDVPRGSQTPMVGRSYVNEPRQALGNQEYQTAGQRAEQLILEAEMAKAKMLPNPPGMHIPIDTTLVRSSVSRIDEDYLVVGGHLDESMQSRIKRGEYVDFGKLLPQNKILSDNESHMEFVIKNGKTYWSPVSDSIVINGFSRWEQAFRIYANIYTKEFPQQSSELIQYNHIIHSISSQYVWDNVYAYDKEFRMHVARHHPQRSWSVILQQAWSMRL